MLAVVVVGTAAAPADAYVLGGTRWPGTTIRYHNLAPSISWSVKEAVRAWNTSGTRLRFVKSSRARADFVIRTFGTKNSWCSGYATLGYVSRGFPAFAEVSRGCNRFDTAGVLAHELGHVLGLHHENRRCATMNTPLWNRCRGYPPAGQWQCRLVQADDVRGAVRRYGGTVKPLGPRFCWKYPPPPPPTSVTATSNPPSGADVLVRWKNTTSGGVSRVEVARGRDACPASPGAGDEHWSKISRPGTTQSIEDYGQEPLETGRYCYALWSYDAGGRTGGPTTVWHDHVDGFLPPSAVQATASPAAGVFTRLQWTSPANPRVDHVLIVRKHGSCPTDPYDAGAIWLDYVASGPAGAVVTWDELEPGDPGAWCYGLWSADDDVGRYGRLGATAVRT